jgi:drug/metabolite transporter (DMT)-like permease
MKQSGAVAVLLGMGTVWGATIPLSKIVVSTGYQPLGLISWQLIFSVIVLTPAVLVRHRAYGQARPPVFTFEIVFYVFMISLLGTLIPSSFFYFSAIHLPGGVMSIIIASVPMFALVIAIVLKLEKPVAIRIMGVVLGAMAVVLLIGPETSLPEPEKAIYVLIFLIAPISYGFEGNYIALRAPKQLDPVTTLWGASVLGAAIVSPLAVYTGTWVDLNIAWQAPEWSLLVLSVLSVIAYTGYIWLVGAAGVVFSSQIAYVIAIAGVILSAIVLNEVYSGWVWAALILMMVGMVMVQPRKNALIVVKE